MAISRNAMLAAGVTAVAVAVAVGISSSTRNNVSDGQSLAASSPTVTVYKSPT